MQFVSFIFLGLKRLRSRAPFTLLLIGSVALAIGMMVCIPVFAGSVSRSIMQQELERKSKAINRPPFSVRFYALPNTEQPLSLRDTAATGQWLGNLLERRIGLRVKTLYVQNESSTLTLQARVDDVHYQGRDLGTVQVAAVAGIERHIQVITGEPFGQSSVPGLLAVWVSPEYANALGLQVGEVYRLAAPYQEDDKYIEPIAVRIAGLWQALAPDDGYWYMSPSGILGDKLLTIAEDYTAYVAPLTPEGIGYVFWYYVLDDARMNLAWGQQYIQGLKQVELEVGRRLPSGRMDYAPTEELARGQERKNALARTLLAFALPLLGILGLFITLVSAMVARSQGQELAQLASRGTGQAQISALILIETLLILAVATPLGLGLGLLLARLLGYSMGFLTFTPRAPLAVQLASADWGYVGLALTLGLLARLLPTWQASRHSVVAYEQQATRRRNTGWVFRLLAIAILGALTYYATYRLAGIGTLAQAALKPGEEAVRDPLLLLAPSLFLFTTPLVAAELFGALMRPLALLGRALPSVTAYLGCINLSREGGQYRAPTYLLVLALSLGIFYASLARSADIWLLERLRYAVGADLTFRPGLPQPSSELQAGSSAAAGASEAALVPISQYRQLPGVADAVRVAELPARTTGKADHKLRLLGIDRQEFARVAYYRADFSPEALGALLNRFAPLPPAMALPAKLAQELGLAQGDRLPLNVLVGETWQRLDFESVGTFDYFPTMYEAQEPVVVVNLSYLEQQLGGVVPYNVWLRLEPEADSEQTLKATAQFGVLPLVPQDLRALLVQDQQRLERVGIFGVLSLCFLAGALVAGLGLLVYHAAELLKRVVRLAVLQALGLQRSGVLRLVLLEYAVTLVYGLAAGLGLGILAARLYVPFFPLIERPERPIPPFLPHVDGQRALWMAAGMGLVLLILGLLVLAQVLRTRVTEALRLGARP